MSSPSSWMLSLCTSLSLLLGVTALVTPDSRQEAKSANPPGKQIAPYEKNSYLRMAQIPGIEGIWQGHLSLVDSDPKHNTSEEMIANLEETAECKGNVIKASVARDGKFTMTNGRNGFSKTYVAR